MYFCKALPHSLYRVGWTLAVLGMTLSLSVPGKAQLSFDTSVGHPVGIRPMGIAVGDFNNDGNLDIDMVHEYRESGARGCGDGNFYCGGGGGYNSVSGPRAITAGELNNDGSADIVSVTANSNELHIRFGNTPDETAHRYYYVNAPRAVSVADVNGDGWNDIVVISESGEFSTLLNQKNNEFAPTFAGTLPFARSGAQAIAVGSAGPSGQVIAAVANSDGNIYVFLPEYDTNNVLQNWIETFSYSAGANPVAVQLKDVDGDSVADIISANADANTVSILHGQDYGDFAAAVHYSVGNAPVGLAIGDVNKDGSLDIVTANRDSGDMTLLVNNGSGAFSTGGTFFGDGAPYAVALGDVNNDSKLDLISMHDNGYDVIVQLGNGSGSFTYYSQVSLFRGTVSLVGDLNRDGRADTVQVSNNSVLTVSLSQGIADFAPPEFYPAYQLADVGGQCATLADINKDGALDIVVVGFYHQVTVRLNDGSGRFDNVTTHFTRTDPRRVAVLDVNGDGNPDIVTATSDEFNLLNNEVTVFTGDGTGNFTEGAALPVTGAPTHLHVGDFNEDGVFDLAMTVSTDDTLRILRNVNGAFVVGATVTVGDNPRYAGVLDANNDGHQDIVTANYDDGTLSLLYGAGDGTFSAPVTYMLGTNPTWVATEDVSGDGLADLTVTLTWGGVSILAGRSDGAFESPLSIAGGVYPSSVGVGDVNGDGKPDLISGQWGYDIFAVMLNTSEFATASLSGSVELEDCFRLSQPLTFVFRGQNSTFTRTVMLNDSGNFTLSSLPRDSYALAIKGAKWLRSVISLDTTEGDVNGESAFLRAGDGNNDNSVDVLDLALIIEAFDKANGDPGFIPGADMNCDDSVDVFDLDLLIRNFDAVGDE